MKPLLILGPTEYALELRDVIEDIPGHRVVGYIEAETKNRAGTLHGGLPVHWVGDLHDLADTHAAVCALGTTFRQKFVQQIEAIGLPFPTVIHPTSHVSQRASLGQGVIVGVGCTVAAFAEIGRHARLNRRAIIGHHLQISDYVTVQPGANIASGVRIGACTYIGMSATVLDGIKIGAHSVVGAGAVVTKDVPDHVQVVGVPAKIVKTGIAGK